MERIPTSYPDPKTGKRLDLTKEDLPVAATFISNSMGLEIRLVETEHRYREDLKKDERIPGTGCALKFRGGRMLVNNKILLQLLMNSTAYQRGQFRIDPEDSTGFWRQAGMVQVKTVQVAVFDGASHPSFGDLDVSKVKATEDAVEPLRAVS